MTMRLDISIGPVQGFVAQSRRTRDLWGSSYLLSCLAGHALHGAVRAGGRVTRPASYDSDALYRWITGQRDGDPPRVGSLPNHLVIEVDGDAQQARRIAQAARAAMEAAWRRICEAVWDGVLSPVAPQGHATREIWDRQTGAFWEFVWVAGPGRDGGLLARRKYWRTHVLPDEPGDKCTVMPDFQELSGFIRAASAEQRQKQDAFWTALRARLGPLDVRDNERLCSIALVKRVFPRVAGQALGWSVETRHWPSTVYVAAVPWIRRAAEHACERARQYAALVEQHTADAFTEWNTPFKALAPQAGGFARLDGNYLHKSFVKHERLCRLDDPQAREQLVARLEDIYRTKVEGRELGSPPIYYALLLADGDRLGRLVGELGGRVVGAALARFTRCVPKIVREHDGVTVYAGGDDVLAMLPVDGALKCADALAQSYGACFAKTSSSAAGVEPTLSAAVLFTHIRASLSTALAEVRRLLDDVAKDQNGRNSLAAGVFRRGGLGCQWVTTWRRPGRDGQGGREAVEQVHALVDAMRSTDQRERVSSSLVHRLHDELTRLSFQRPPRPGEWIHLPDTLEIGPLVRASALRSLESATTEAGGDDANVEARAARMADALVEILRPARNDATNTGPRQPDAPARNEIGLDGLLLARFLATGGQEE